MADRLDSLLLALKRQPADRRLDQLEPRVWQALDEARPAPGPAGAGFALRVSAVVGALFLGVAAGGLGATDSSSREDEISVFSIGPQLAPSTLLEGRG
ncbi:hypothetical protein [Phenylobacterium sp. J367]|uniref:hypothetical protein n=1 Tax=Phenylobacterium sp. J367 TaxID=2898435 RepID=UPI002151ADD6|nr:hypothetical protein [Phenylobacterium sp. J367]MCR5879302.1 hypothetical protein [Phenylobacterium sp. J367]